MPDESRSIEFRAARQSSPDQNARGHAGRQESGCARATKERFQERDEEERETVKTLLVNFRNMYGFLSQVLPYQDSDLE